MEVRYGLRDCTDRQARKALDWAVSREAPRRHRGGVYLPERTHYDRSLTGGYRSETGEYIRVKYLKLPTGEQTWNTAIEYIYLLLAWEKEFALAEAAGRARESFLDIYPGPYRRPEKVQLGFHCCGSCNAVYQKTMKLADPELYAKQEKPFMDRLRENRTSTGRWKISKCPFYYMILTLDELNTDATREELANVAGHMKPSLLSRYQGNSRISKFRRLAIETALKYA